MRKLTTFLPVLFLAALLAACRNKKPDIGGGIPPKQMQQILLDISLAETYSAMAKDSVHKVGKNMDSLAAFYKDIFNHYHISQDKFMTSLSWYKAHPDQLDTLYSNMITVITKMQEAQNQKK